MTTSCPKCQHENPDDTVFCGKCGTHLTSAEDIPAQTKTIEAPKEELTTGSTFASKYQIIEEIGKGGMGRVYKALDTEVKEKIAVKLIKPEIAVDKNTIERFRNELKLARKVSHKNVCRMFDLNKEEGSYYITMEYVDGQNLKGFIRQSGQLAIGTALNLAKQVCEGLTEAHRLGVVHRDLKPSNIMIDQDGSARIMDFGIARSTTGKGLTDKGVMIGTPEYMSPEQVEGKEIDQRTDIYSLGIILYEMLTGRVPFEGDTALTVAVKHKTEEPKEPKEYNEQISDDLNGIILKCLEKEKRYQSAGELRSELENIEEGIPISDTVLPKRRTVTSKEITVTFGLRKLLVPALVFIGIVIIGVAIWQLLPEREVTSPYSEMPSIGVLPFIDLSPQKDQEHFCDGMTDEIISKLSRFSGWKVLSRTSMMRYKNVEKDPKDMGQELGITMILEGSVRMEKGNLRVSARLINTADGFQLWSNTYDRKLESIFVIQNDIAESITKALEMNLSPEEKEQLRKKPTENLNAYNLYLHGDKFLLFLTWNAPARFSQQ
ncbi:protein kinase [Acidobacteriota bacterium]